MTILSKTFPGLMRVCDGCGALLGYSVKDIYEKRYVYCINCKHKNEVSEIVDAQLVEVKKENEDAAE